MLAVGSAWRTGKNAAGLFSAESTAVEFEKLQTVKGVLHTTESRSRRSRSRWCLELHTSVTMLSCLRPVRRCSARQGPRSDRRACLLHRCGDFGAHTCDCEKTTLVDVAFIDGQAECTLLAVRGNCVGMRAPAGITGF